MSPKSSKIWKALALLIPTMLILGACESTNNIVVTDNGAVTIKAEIKETEGFLKTMDITCDALVDGMKMDKKDAELLNFKVENKSSGEVTHCLLSADSRGVSAVDDDFLIDTGDTYILKFTNDDDPKETAEAFKMFKVDFKLSVTMPGKIVKAEGAEIAGNTATFTDFAAFFDTVTVEGEKKATGNAKAEGKKKDKNDKDDDDKAVANSDSDSNSDSIGFLGMIIFGAIVGGLIGLIIALVKKNKNKNNPQLNQAAYAPVPPQGQPIPPAGYPIPEQSVPPQGQPMPGYPAPPQGQPMPPQAPNTPPKTNWSSN